MSDEVYVKTVGETEEFARRWKDETGRPRSPSITDVLVKLEEMQAKIDLLYQAVFDE